jgi:hypothetical protein
MKIQREEFLAVLESVSPGLSPKNVIEQSNAFALKDGKVMTYNEEVFCQAPLDTEGIEGAVQSDSLLNVLRKLPDPELELARTEGFLVFKGKGKKLEVRMEAEVLLPVEQIEVPKKWVSLGPEFSEALLMVQECAIEEDKQKFMATCVNIAPGWMEATDNRTQMMRYTLETGIKQACLIKKSGAKDVAGMGPSKMSETDAWLHFKNSARLVISCRR